MQKTAPEVKNHSEIGESVNEKMQWEQRAKTPTEIIKQLAAKLTAYQPEKRRTKIRYVPK